MFIHYVVLSSYVFTLTISIVRIIGGGETKMEFYYIVEEGRTPVKPIPEDVFRCFSTHIVFKFPHILTVFVGYFGSFCE